MLIVPSVYRGSKEYHLVFSELISAAQRRGAVTYQEVAALIGLPLRGAYMGRQVGHIVGEISEDEVRQGRPMLSAIVVSTQGRTGDGFFELARELGLLQDNSPAGRRQFLATMQQDVYRTWKRPLTSTYRATRATASAPE